MPFIEGDPANDAVLTQAGIERARSLIACADADPQNIFITSTARELRADIPISRQLRLRTPRRSSNAPVLIVWISPYKASGTEMARLALHPQSCAEWSTSTPNTVSRSWACRREDCEGARQMIGDVRGGAMIVGLRRGSRVSPSAADRHRAAARRHHQRDGRRPRSSGWRASSTRPAS